MATVTAVVCTAFDPATDEQIYRVREQVRAAGVTLPERPPHRPHFSLAAARVTRDAGLDRVVETAAQLADSQVPLEVTLDEVGRFGRAGVVWLGPSRRAQPLATLQREVDAALRAQGWPRAFGERSDPAQWVAHCTLATRLPKPQLREVQAAVRIGYSPIRARIDALAVILVGGRGDIAHLPLSVPPTTMQP
jgi:2'-5' RNA ligase